MRLTINNHRNWDGLLGIKDCFDNWFLVLRCSALDSFMGMVPGICAAVIDWLSYGHALRTEKGGTTALRHRRCARRHRGRKHPWPLWVEILLRYAFG
jgi:hypothetical protein